MTGDDQRDRFGHRNAGENLADNKRLQHELGRHRHDPGRQGAVLRDLGNIVQDGLREWSRLAVDEPEEMRHIEQSFQASLYLLFFAPVPLRGPAFR